MKLKKIQAGALQYVLFISIIIAIIISALILIIYINKQYANKAQIYQEQIIEVNNAFEILRKNKEVLQNSQQNQPKKEGQEITQTNTSWGVFSKVTIHTSRKNQAYQKTALIGGYKEQKPALYLQETNKPLVLVGTTEIEGKVYLPAQGVKRGTIAGHPYIGNQLIKGNKARSRKQLPQLENRKQIQQLCKGIITIPTEPFQLERNSIEKPTYINTFKNTTKYYRTKEIIKLENITISGNYIIQSDTKILIKNTSALKGIILIAPYIEIQEKTIGSFQVFATKEIIIQKNCKLLYPTSIVLAENIQPTINQRQQKQIHQIKIETDTEIRGSICFLTNNKENNHNVQIEIQENATIIGEVYCEKNIALYGNINGSAYTQNFITNAFGSIYHNHIYNGKIKSKKLAKQFGGLLFKNEEKQIVEWLY